MIANNYSYENSTISLKLQEFFGWKLYDEKSTNSININTCYKDLNFNPHIAIDCYSTLDQIKMIKFSFTLWEKFEAHPCKKTYHDMMANEEIDNEKIANFIKCKIDGFTFKEVQSFWMHIYNMHCLNTDIKSKITIEY